MALSLQVDTFATGLGGDQELALILKSGNGLSALSMPHRAIYKLDFVCAEMTPQGLAQVILCRAVLGEDQHLFYGVGCKNLADDLIDEELEFAVVMLELFSFLDQII